MQIVVIDTETTGIDPAEGAALLEAAHVCVTRNEGQWGYGESGTYDSDFIEYTGDIPASARAVNHISPDDVRPGNGAIPYNVFVDRMTNIDCDDKMYCAHNAEFDKQFLPELDLPWLCTWRISLHLYPDAPSHSAQCLRYWLDCHPPAEMLEGLSPHRALFDAACTAALLHRMLQEHPVEELLRLTTAPAVLRTVRFGRHRGEPWSEVPKSYLQWVLRDSTFDKDVLHTARTYLNA